MLYEEKDVVERLRILDVKGERTAYPFSPVLLSPQMGPKQEGKQANSFIIKSIIHAAKMLFVSDKRVL